MLPSTAIKAHILPNIKHSLVSIRALCDAGCTVTFRIKYDTFVYNNNIILRRWINHPNKVWYFPLSVENKDEQVGENKNNIVRNVYEKKNQAELASFYMQNFSAL